MNGKKEYYEYCEGCGTIEKISQWKREVRKALSYIFLFSIVGIMGMGVLYLLSLI